MRKAPILALVLTLCGCAENYSNGSRIGVVTKLSEKGFICKSWEGEMLIALPNDMASGAQPEKFAFNVDPPTVPKVQEAMKSGKRVELLYRQWMVSPPCIDNDHVIIDVKPVEKGK
jgi:hypothetical protein